MKSRVPRVADKTPEDDGPSWDNVAPYAQTIASRLEETVVEMAGAGGSIGSAGTGSGSWRPGPAWIPGEIVQQLGPVSYLVDVYGDRPWKCHADQLKERMDVPTPQPACSEVPNQLAGERTPDFDVAQDWVSSSHLLTNDRS